MINPGKIENPQIQLDAMPKPKDIEQLFKIRHSLAHIMAQAVVDRFQEAGPVKLGIGPPIEEGFYYDFDLPRPITEEDLLWIEKRVKEIVKQDVQFKQEIVSQAEAEVIFAEEPFKLDLIDSILNGNTNEDGNSLEESQSSSSEISIFRHGEHVDLCRGPHIQSSMEINPDAFKILSFAGAYWRGEEKNPMLSRIYATAWQTKDELDRYLALVEKRKLRDHRQIGRKLELFHFDQSAPGMPYWLPNGLIILNELLSLWRRVHYQRGYLEFSAPIINDKKLWEQSGHWDHYREEMFVVPADSEGDIEYGIKPMNCPNAMVLFNLKTRSYRDLPLRLSDCDVLHRNERSGTMHGLLRVRKFQQDDAHIFLEEEMLEAEFKEIFELADYFYKIFSMRYEFRLSKRPASFVGELKDWDKAESILKKVLDDQVGANNYRIQDGEGAFYGPKIDILMRDSLDRSWQMGTIQLDFQLPKRFKCKYIAKDGTRNTPVVIHRVIYGSIDRFIGILLEHTAGNLPTWLAPTQVVVMPLSDGQIEYAQAVNSLLQIKGIRSFIDAGSTRVNKRIREATLMKIPYIVIVGDTEKDSGNISVRKRSGEQLQNVEPSVFIEDLLKEIADSK